MSARTTVFFGIVALICLFLASGFSEYEKQLYVGFINLPMFRAFREASNWIFFVVVAFCILISCTRAINVSQMQKAIATLEWNTLKHSVFINQTLPNKKLTVPEIITWKQVNPTRYEVNVENTEPFILVLLENFDERWKVYVNNNLIPETNHYKVNIFANGWFVDTNGKLKITIRYETQSIIQQSVIASILLPALFLVFLYRKDVKAVTSLIHSKCSFRRRSKINV